MTDTCAAWLCGPSEEDWKALVPARPARGCLPLLLGAVAAVMALWGLIRAF